MHEKLDGKNIGVAKVVLRLRQDIDIFRVIGLNVSVLRSHGVSPKLWGHIQGLAQQSIALSICKIYEDEKRNDLNSIPGVIAHLPQSNPSDELRARIDGFRARYCCGPVTSSVQSALRQVFDRFRTDHHEALLRLKMFRDKVCAHSEHGIDKVTLASIDEFEALFQFAADFYRLVSDGVLDIGPAMFSKHVEVGLLRVLTSLGIESPRRDFSDKN